MIIQKQENECPEKRGHHTPAGVAVTVLQPGNVDTPIIDAFGLDRTALPVRPQSADKAVQSAIKAFLRGRAVHIPGRTMGLLGRLMPRSISARMNGRMLGTAARNLAGHSSTAA